jgi:hypothetical protein
MRQCIPAFALFQETCSAREKLIQCRRLRSIDLGYCRSHDDSMNVAGRSPQRSYWCETARRGQKECEVVMPDL